MLNHIRKHLHLVVILSLILGLGGHYLWNLEFNTGYTPDQPIPFSHKLHAGDYRIDCLYCHSGAEKGPNATVPSMNVCMGCHSVIAVDKESIQTMTRLYNEGQPLQWVRVHRLPDHAYFTHDLHVRAGVECRECHGPVESMAVVGQVKRLKMGDCLACHRKSEYSDAYFAGMDTVPGKDYADRVYRTFPYMKYLGGPTLSSAARTGALPEPLPVPEHSAVGVLAGHNAMTQCSTCHQ